LRRLLPECLQHLAQPCLAQAMEVEAPAFPLTR
jgi:hypothetical protein